MRTITLLALVLITLVRPSFAAAENAIRVELNAAKAAQNLCHLSFVIENEAAAAIESLKLDLVVFNTDGTIDRRLVTEMGPLRGSKTMVKTFALQGDCARVGSILVNDVTACAPAEAGDCLNRLVLTSRLSNLRLFR